MDERIRAEVRNPKEVMELLESARKAQESRDSTYSARYVAQEAGIDPSTWHQWVNEGREGGCCHVAKAGLVLGLYPDQVLLKAGAPGPADLKADERRDLNRIWNEVIAIRNLCEGAKLSPLTVFAEHLAEVRGMVARRGVPEDAQPELTAQLHQRLAKVTAYLAGVLQTIPTDSVLGKLIDAVCTEIDRLSVAHKTQRDQDLHASEPRGAGAGGEASAAGSGAQGKDQKAGPSRPSSSPRKKKR